MAVNKKNSQRLHICYNAPVTLTFSLLATLILILNQYLDNKLIPLFFTATGKHGSAFAFDWKNLLDYFRLFTHVLGHADWNHLISNLSFILLLGPLLEERYGSGMLLLMMFVTALVTGVLNACFIPSALLGASGIVFMMILLSSFTTITKNQIPLTFILIVILYMGKELVSGFKQDDISSLAHIVGGLCGSLFGFLGANTNKRTKNSVSSGKEKETKSYSAKKTHSSEKNKSSSSSFAEDDKTVEVSSIKF